MDDEAFTTRNPRSFVGIFSDYGSCVNTEKPVSLTDSIVQAFLEGEENPNTERKTKVTHSGAFVMAFLGS